MPIPGKILFCLQRQLTALNSLDRRFLVGRRSVSLNQAKIKGEEEESLCGPPRIRSPFDSPNRCIVREAAAMAEVATPATVLIEQQAATKSETSTQNESGDGGRVERAETGRDKIEESTQQEEQQRTNDHELSERKEEERERDRRQQRQWAGVKWGIYGLSLTSAAGLVYLFVRHGGAPKDPVTNQALTDQYSGTVLAPVWRVWDYVGIWKRFISEPSREKLLPDPVKPPWHQPKYTVVMELRNVLVSPKWDYKTGHYFVRRPALEYFMDVVGYPNFELVIYTSENMMNAAPVVTQIDAKGNRINHVLFRDCTKYQRGAHMKDLSRLNRDLSKVIYIDWEPAAFQLNTENVLRVPKWEGDMADTYLVDLAELLKTIHLSDVDDVRPILQFYSEFDNPPAEFRRRAQTLAQETATKQQADAASAQDGFLKKYRGNLFGARRHSV